MDINQLGDHTMAILRNGPNGGFSGKVGSVVGYKWKGKDVIRGLPRKNNQPRSEARLANEQAMKLIMGTLAPLKVFIRAGFRNAVESLDMTAFNLALSLNKKQAIKGEHPNLEIEWSKFRISQGELPGLEDVTAAWGDNGLKLSWRDGTGAANAYGTDSLSVVVYSHQTELWYNFLNHTSRNAQQCDLPAHEKWIGSEVEVFLSLVSFGGGLVSDSMHIHVPAIST